MISIERKKLEQVLEALDLAQALLEFAKSNHHPKVLAAYKALEETLAQPDYRAVKTYHGGKPVYVARPEQEPEPVAFAGIEMWMGNTRVTRHLTQTELHYATQPWLHMLVNAEKCVAALKEKNT